ncbi:hypothetical protein GCM10009760_23140 [Kitasatospora kazusensis]|uniref:Uncharacterized protein n=1 Tax=Kitasatospora kazusensis TaxID=407974 RepID=A0ABN2ZCN4_9ACTN
MPRVIAESSSAVSRVTTRMGAPGTRTGPFAVFTVTLGTGGGLGVSVPVARVTRGPRAELVQPVSSAAPSPERAVRRDS